MLTRALSRQRVFGLRPVLTGQGASSLLDYLDFSHISARLKHPGQDSEVIEAFKNFPRALAAHPAGVTRKTKIEIWFQDDARAGQNNGLVRQWARRGRRPIQLAGQRCESACLFGAICPARGIGAGLALPFAGTEAMQLHLGEISLRVAEKMPAPCC